MSKRRSRSGPARIIKRFTPQPLTEAQRDTLELARKAVLASKEDRTTSYQTRLNERRL